MVIHTNLIYILVGEREYDILLFFKPTITNN